MRSTYDVLNDISKYWDKMSKAQQSALGLQLAGKTQIDVFTSTLRNFKTAQDATVTAMNSAGSATKENSKYMESLSSKVTLLKAQFEEIVLGEGGLSDFLKLLVDGGTSILKFVDSDIGGMIIKFVALGTALKLLQVSFIKFKTLIDGKEFFVSFLSYLKKVELGTFSLSGALNVLKVSYSPFLVGGAILLGLYAIYKIVNDTEGRLRKAQETLEKTQKTLKGTQEEYDSLSSRDSNLNDAEKERLKYLENQLKILKEQETQQQSNVAQRGLENYKSTKERTSVKHQGGQKFTYTTEIKITGQEALDNTIQKVKQLDQTYKAGDITRVDWINQQQEMVNGLDETWRGYESLINSGKVLTPVQLANAQAIAQMNVNLNEAGGKSNVLSSTLLLYASNLRGEIIPVTELFSSTLVKEGDTYFWVSQQAKSNANAVIQAEIDKTQTVLDNAKARLDIFKQEQDKEALIMGNKMHLPTFAEFGLKKTKDEINVNQKQLDKWKKQLKDVGSISVKLPVTGGGLSKATDKDRNSGGSKLKSTTDKYKERADKEIATLKHQYEMGKITTEKYYISLEKLNKKYFKGKKKYLNDYRNYEEEVYKGLQKLEEERLQKAIDKMKAQASLMEKYAEHQQDLLQSQIDAIDEQINALDEQNDALAKQIEYEELLANLAKAKSIRVKIYREGQGFVYESDINEVAKAQKALEDFNHSQAIEETKKALESQKKDLERQKQAWADFVTNFKQQQEIYDLEQQAGADREKLIFDKRITSLADFVAKYKALMAELAMAQMMEQPQSIIEQLGESVGGAITGGFPGMKPKPKPKPKPPKKPPKKPSKHANGTNYLDSSKLVNYNEQGSEIIIPPSLNGDVGFMSKGTGIIPHTISENLLELGKFSMNGLKNIISPNNTDGTNIQTGNWVFPNITDSSKANDLFNEIKKFKSLAIQESYKRV